MFADLLDIKNLKQEPFGVDMSISFHNLLLIMRERPYNSEKSLKIQIDEAKLSISEENQQISPSVVMKKTKFTINSPETQIFYESKPNVS